MQHLVWLLTPLLLGVMMLNVPRSSGFQNSSAQPVVTPGTEPAEPSKQPAPAPSPNPYPSVSPATPSASPIRDRETIIRLKIFLDQHSFGPGEIDDRWTDLCANALRLYQSAHGNGASGIDPELKQELSNLAPLYVSYQIKPDDLAWVGKSPHKLAAQAKRKFMPYPSIANFVAERFHTNLSFLANLNRGKNLSNLRSGDTVYVPNVPPLELSGLKEEMMFRPDRRLKIAVWRSIPKAKL
jgi:hypothetical protein